ncbi:MAG: tetratricopeptide repeat protein [Bacteroidetes bacterium]|nr:tetratricopeptide repeat protein [Bacteroidota bacterium]
MRKVLSLIFILPVMVFAQDARSSINDGVELYNQEKYTEAESKFMDGLNEDYETFEGHFNLGDAYYKQGKFEDALKAYQNAMALSKDDKQRSQIYHNVGNTFVKDKKLKEGIEAYKNSLRLDPTDNETKYNLSYALRQQQQQDQQQKQNQDQDKDKDKNKDKDQQKQDQQKQDQKQDENKDKDQKQDEQNQDQEQQQPQPKDQMSKEEAQRILEALKNNETDLQKKLRKKKSKVIKKEKDW